jgi:hypothetical protein
MVQTALRGETGVRSRIMGAMSYLADISQMTSNFVEIVPRPHLQGNCIPFAAIR